MNNALAVKVGNIFIGKNYPVVIQSMTDTDTSNIKETVDQILDLYHTGSEIIRITINNEQAAKAVPKIKEELIKNNCNVPLVGDFHYNGHILLKNIPECSQILDKYRINPGNVGFGYKKDKQFIEIIEQAITYNKPIRIGANWGSIDTILLNNFIEKNKKRISPLSYKEVIYNVLIESALHSAQLAENIGLNANKIIISCKMSNVQDTINVYEKLYKQSKYPLHLGLTEAGSDLQGIISSSISLGILLYKGIGDTIRVSLTPKPQEKRSKEVTICKQILQNLGIRKFFPIITSCPGCGRTNSHFFRNMVYTIQQSLKEKMNIWSQKYIGVEKMTVAVMGCIVNGPGESKHANIGISLPGISELERAPVFINGKKKITLKGKTIIKDFIVIIEEFVNNNYSKK